MNRFITGSAAPDVSGAGGTAAAASPSRAAEPRPEQRTEVVRPEAYASELPDLSGPTPPKPAPQQRSEPAPEQPARPAGGRRPSPGGGQPTSRTGAGQHADPAASIRGAR